MVESRGAGFRDPAGSRRPEGERSRAADGLRRSWDNVERSEPLSVALRTVAAVVGTGTGHTGEPATAAATGDSGPNARNGIRDLQRRPRRFDQVDLSYHDALKAVSRYGATPPALLKWFGEDKEAEVEMASMKVWIVCARKIRSLFGREIGRAKRSKENSEFRAGRCSES